MSLTDTPTARGRYPNRWPKGVSGNPLGRRLSKQSELERKERIDGLVAALLQERDPLPSQRELLVVAAAFIVDSTYSRDAQKRTKLANSADRLLRSIPMREPPKQPQPTIADLERREAKP